MSWQTGDPATRIRHQTALYAAVAAAAGLQKSVFVSTFDDAKPRRLTGVYSTFQTKFFNLHIRVAGKDIAVIDMSQFAASHGMLEFDQMYGANVQLEYALESPAGSGAAIAANTDQIVFRYETTPDN